MRGHGRRAVAGEPLRGRGTRRRTSWPGSSGSSASSPIAASIRTRGRLVFVDGRDGEADVHEDVVADRASGT